MQKQTKQLDFSGQTIYTGIDAHKKNWTVAIYTEAFEHKVYSQDPDPSILASYLTQNFPGANYKSAYEAGFCGFWIHESLTQLGIENIVVNAADIPTTDKEKKQKRDKSDARKLAKALRGGRLQGIYTPNRVDQELRSLLRTRQHIVEDMVRCKNRIKSMLDVFGIKLPTNWEGRRWSGKFIIWLEEVPFTTEQGRKALDIYLIQLKALRSLVSKLDWQLHCLAGSESLSSSIKWIRSVPGVGLISALVFKTELIDIRRFRDIDHLCSYVGLIPDVRASGETETTGEMTRRGNRFIRKYLVEAAWRAIREDPALMISYQQWGKRMKKNQAIIRVAKKLLNRLRYVWLNEQTYTLALVS